MKITRNQLRQLIKEELDLSTLRSTKAKLEAAILELGKHNDPNLNALGSVLGHIVTDSLYKVAGKTPEEFEKVKNNIVSYINSKKPVEPVE